MARHRHMRTEVEGSEYYDDPAMYDSDDEERRIDMNDGCSYTFNEFMEFYGGTVQWENAKPEKKKEKKKVTQQKPNKGQGNQKNNQQPIKKTKDNQSSKQSNTKEKNAKLTPQQEAKPVNEAVASPPPAPENPIEKKPDPVAVLVKFLTKLNIEEPEYAAEKLAFENLDIIGLKSASRDDLLEIGLHPRVIDHLMQQLKNHSFDDESGGACAEQSNTLTIDGVQDANEETSGNAKSPSSSSSSGELMLSFKDRQWKRPKRPTEAEAAALASGGGLYVTRDHGGKHLLSMVVVGHVDAGKSTLMGQLLVSSGVVAPRVASKYQKEATEMGKGSFYLAWVMDEGEDERKHGVTIEVAEKFIETPTKVLKILDAPGHADFVPQMIMGTCQADVGLLVVAAPEPEFESGFGGGGQTKEHAMLLKSLGVNQLLVAVNKMDNTMPLYSRDRFDYIVTQLTHFLVSECKFKRDKVRFVPVSAFVGENVTKPANSEEWVAGLGVSAFPPLLNAIDDFKIPPRLTSSPLRIVVSDILRESAKGVVVSALVLQGSVDVSQPLLLRPANDRCVLKAMSKDEVVLAFASAGDSVQMTLSDIDSSRIFVGNVLCSLVPVPIVGDDDAIETVVPLSKKFTARISTFNALSVPFIKGTQVTLHIGSSVVEANVSKLVSLLDSTGAQRKIKPRAIGGGSGAIIQVKLDTPLCIETQQNCKGLGRFVMRQRGVTVAAGLITEVH